MTETEKRVPELRFEDFVEDWEQRKLGELIENQTIILQSDGNHGELYPKSTEFSETGIPYLSASNIDLNTSTIDFSSSKYLPINKAKIFKKGIAKNGDILLAHNATVGPTVMLSTHYPFVVLSTTLTLFRINQSKMNPNFFLYTLRSVQFQHALKKMMKQTTRNQVPILTQRNIDVSYPNNIDEQAKLGIFFKQLDETIALHQRKLTLLKRLKQTYLHGLFPQNHGNKPTLRFAGFPDSWSQSSLGELAKFEKGKGYSKKDLVEYGFRAILYGRLYTKYQTVIETIDTFVESDGGSIHSKIGDVIVPASGESSEDISRASVVPYSGIILGGDINIIEVDKNKLDPIFVALAISHGTQKKELSKLAKGKSIVHLHNSDLKKVILNFPKLEEQKKIGKLVKQLDDTIELQHHKINSIQLLKSTLLDKMFI